MLVGDKKGMQVPSENSLGESYPLRSEQRVNSRGQSPIINPSSAEQTQISRARQNPIPAGKQQESCQSPVPEHEFGVCSTSSSEAAGLFASLVKQMHSSKVRPEALQMGNQTMPGLPVVASGTVLPGESSPSDFTLEGVSRSPALKGSLSQGLTTLAAKKFFLISNITLP